MGQATVSHPALAAIGPAEGVSPLGERFAATPRLACEVLEPS